MTWGITVSQNYPMFDEDDHEKQNHHKNYHLFDKDDHEKQNLHKNYAIFDEDDYCHC